MRALRWCLVVTTMHVFTFPLAQAIPKRSRGKPTIGEGVRDETQPQITLCIGLMLASDLARRAPALQSAIAALATRSWDNQKISDACDGCHSIEFKAAAKITDWYRREV